MIKLYPGFYLFLVLSYLAGRIGMVSMITGSNADKRYINFRVIPRNIHREIAATIQKEERTAGYIRYEIFQFHSFKNTYSVKFSFPQNTFRYFYDRYEGSYLDPPDIT